MFLNLTQLKQGLKTLDEARKTFRCQAPRVDSTGAASVRRKEKDVPYGPHGAAFMEVNPVTGEVRCAVCAGSMTHVEKPKVTRVIKGREHYVGGE